ncbi:uncharacterized protein EAF01_004638 [Botrytis porri]|uniref:Uncharacterized protein n=1 Tax=Botrytis porri TaxID=87229 RepID=A0A4Z1KND2_9HELO|nr:uncharacterized protein EAF01_004638 [Botrytis porri]KAF7907051.1 hypothetical protein EAF01_004638 [Botrytis porri]TGO87623.1 hypothetical protein BPOR_0214g00090 [Botrytis porri]
MGKSELIPKIQPKKRVRPVSNPLYTNEEAFFCNILKHHHVCPGEQFPAFDRLYSVSLEHGEGFYLGCQTFYTFTLEFMDPEKCEKSTEIAPPTCQVVVRPKSYKKPAKYDIQQLTPIDESSESTETIEERTRNGRPCFSMTMFPRQDFDHRQDEQLGVVSSQMPATIPNNKTLLLGIPHYSIPPLSPMSKMIQDLEYPSLLVPTETCSSESLDSIHGQLLKPSIAEINGIESSKDNGLHAISIHSISANPAPKVPDEIQPTSQFPNLIYDTRTDRYIEKSKAGIEEYSRLNDDLAVDSMHTTTHEARGEKGMVVSRIVDHPEAAIMKYTNSDGTMGIRPLRMKSQVQDNGLYREFKVGLGNESAEDVVKRHLRMASEPERLVIPGSDQHIGPLRADTIPIKRIARHSSANSSRKLEDSPTLSRRNSRRRKAGPIYLPACSENRDGSPKRPLFTPVNTRSPSPRAHPVRSPPPMDRPYRHMSQLSINNAPGIDSPSTQDRGSVESDISSVAVDVTSFVPPRATTPSPAIDITSVMPQLKTTKSPTISGSPIKVPTYTLSLPNIFSSPSPIAPPPKVASAVPAAPMSKSNSTNILSAPIFNQIRHGITSSIYSLHIPESFPHNNVHIQPQISRIPSVPSPPTTPTASLFRSDTTNTKNTVSTVPSTPTQGTYSHSRHNTYSTDLSSIASPMTSPLSNVKPSSDADPFRIPSPSLNAFSSPNAAPYVNPSPIPCPRSNLSEESIALTEHLVREGIYGGIVYDIAASPNLYPTHPEPPVPHLTKKLTPSQLQRKKKRAARKLQSALRKRAKAEKREKKAAAKQAKTTLKRIKSRTRKAKLAVQSKKGTLNYLTIRVFFRSLGNGVRMKWQGARRRLSQVQFSKVLGARQERKVAGDGFDFVCRGESEDKNWEDVRMSGGVLEPMASREGEEITESKVKE